MPFPPLPAAAQFFTTQPADATMPSPVLLSAVQLSINEPLPATIPARPLLATRRSANRQLLELVRLTPCAPQFRTVPLRIVMLFTPPATPLPELVAPIRAKPLRSSV